MGSLLLASTLCTLPGTAQVLARPGWAGSGVAPEAWWSRAVFYRIDPARFQDSNGDGRGDLPGIAQRLDYLQSLGIDALLLDGDLQATSTGGLGALGDLGDLIRQASQRHLRVLLTVTPALQQQPRATLLATVHDWLGAGAAGIWLPEPPAGSDAAFGALQEAIRSLLANFPGVRILLSDPAPTQPGPALSRSRRSGGDRRDNPSTLLVISAVFPVGTGSVNQLRSGLLATANEGTERRTEPLLRFAGDPPAGSPEAAADGALLLASRGAVILDFGVEIGLDTYPASTLGKPGGAADGTLPIMQWTPSNHTLAALETAQNGGAPAPAEPVYGAYHPYQPPPRALTGGMQSTVRVTEDANVPAAPPAPDTLPGFTTRELPAPAPDSARRNVIVEDRDPESLLNQYRQLIALHHDNATLRNGTEYILPPLAEGTLFWVRRAPAGSRTVGNVLAAENRTGSPVTLDLDRSLQAQGIRPGALRALFSSAPTATTGESTGHLVLPPHAVLLGEIFHGGLIEPESGRRAGRHGRRHSGRRVRR